MFYLNSSIVFFPNAFPRTSEPKCSSYAESNDQPQNIGHAIRFNASEPVQNTSKSLKEYRQLHHRVWHRLQNHHLETLNSSPRPSTMRSMTQSRCPRRGSQKHLSDYNTTYLCRQFLMYAKGTFPDR